MSGPRPTLDVRAFPSDPSLLLILLAAGVLLSDLFFALWLAELNAPLDCSSATYPACPKDAGAMFSGTVTHLLQVLTPGMGMYALSAWLRRRRAVPLRDTAFQGAAETVERLVGQAGLGRRPTVLVGRRLRSGACVTGPLGGPHLLLGPELLALHDKGGQQRRVFETVVRHELAHLQSGDLRPQLLTTLLRWSNLYAGAFAVFALTLTLSGDDIPAGDYLFSVVRVVLLALLGELIARAYLRVREHHADLRAGTADPEGLLATMRAGAAGAAGPGLRVWLRHHPLGSDRLAVALAPSRLLASSPGRLLLGATVAGVLLATLQDLLLRIAAPGSGVSTAILCGAVIGTALTLFFAFSLWGHAWHADAPGRAWPAAAAALTVGLPVGSHLAVFTRVSGRGLTGIPPNPLLLAVLAGGALLLCGWLAALGAAWRRGDPQARRVPRFLALAVPAACAVGGWLFAMFWTWAASLLGLSFCPDFPDAPLCRLADPERRIAVSMLATFGSGPVLPAVVLVASAAIPLALFLARRPERGGWEDQTGSG
ncbi:hypothetical protein GCM10010517_35960 [Streptosporangium fragile]|uniref:Peptidase M48 domain-containing protein n=1 Tax=Streptosporangium fragile TaxID=46186 RepID=A0ABN3VZW1_9ACTN